MSGPLAPGEWKRLTPTEIDDRVDEWLDLPGTLTVSWHDGAEYTLQQYLGMTFKEYGKWLIG